MSLRRIGLIFLATLVWTVAGWAAGPPGPVYVGLDAEFGHQTSTAAVAIERGMQIAIDEINRAGGVLGGRPLALVTRDNRSVPARAMDNLRELAAMPDLVAVMGGKFSPVLIECLPLAHELGLPLLDPWGSADGITDHTFRPSYTFRLSLKDAWAAPVLLRYATARGTPRLGLMLPNTAWGRSNQQAVHRALNRFPAVRIVAEHWYNWGDATLLAPYQRMRAKGAQAILMVANEKEGSLLAREIAALPAEQRLPIYSHWGITGGKFFEMAGDALKKIDLAVVQTYSFIGAQSERADRIVAELARRYGLGGPEDIEAPVGTAHAYDLTHLLARAIDQAGSTDRRRIRDALEELGPYAGLIKTYRKPFAPDRHDALSASDIFMARYDDRGVLRPIGPMH